MSPSSFPKASPETVLIRAILARHGARPDLRLWRNETAGAWVGKVAGRTKLGHLVLSGAKQILAGLCVGSADLIGIRAGGQLLAIECKTGSQDLEPAQRTFRDVVVALGGLHVLARSVEDVDAALGPPPA